MIRPGRLDPVFFMLYFVVERIPDFPGERFCCTFCAAADLTAYRRIFTQKKKQAGAVRPKPYPL